VFLPVAGKPLPLEPRRLGIVLSGPREVPGWQDGLAARKDQPLMDFFDLKGVLEQLAHGLRIGTLIFKPTEDSTFHPGRTASVYLHGKQVGVAGELHPLVRATYKLDQPAVAAELDLDLLDEDIPLVDSIKPIINQPAVYQDIALVVGEATPAGEVEQVIVKAGGDLLREAKLFDVYRGDPIPQGKKSLAYALTYQAEDRTLTDKEVAKVHQQIVRAAEHQLGATLRA
jgi:phenylalanyl-tRNA synthetase beta chain